jgi:hypothetical protein
MPIFRAFSMITSTQFALPDFGSPSMKSIEMVCQEPSGIGSGASKPGYLDLQGFAYWHMVQDLT